jgi:branched-chain amino acid transport system permease protein
MTRRPQARQAFDLFGVWAIWMAVAGGGIAVVVSSGRLEYERLALQVLFTAILAMSWNSIGGLAGVYSFANPVFFGIGAYAAAIGLRDHPHISIGLEMLLGALAATGAGIVMTPAFRARTLYFAIMTVAIASGTLVAFEFYGPGTVNGLEGSFTASPSNGRALVLALGLLAIASLVFRVVQLSTMGKALRLIRVDEDAAAAIGVPTTRLKIWAFLLGAPTIGAAGALFMLSNAAFIDAPTAFDATNAIVPMLATLLGGLGTFGGPLIGSAAWQIGAFKIRQWVADPGIVQMVTGGVLMIVILKLPRGLVGAWDGAKRIALLGARRGAV